MFQVKLVTVHVSLLLYLYNVEKKEDYFTTLQIDNISKCVTCMYVNTFFTAFKCFAAGDTFLFRVHYMLPYV